MFKACRGANEPVSLCFDRGSGAFQEWVSGGVVLLFGGVLQ